MLTCEATPSGGLINYSYDDSGLLLTLGNVRGDTRSFSYDAAGKLAGFTDGDGQTTCTYDANGNLTSVALQSSEGAEAQTVTRMYDSGGRVTAATDTLDNETGYGYDSNTATSLCLPYPDGRQVHYTYDALGTPSWAK